MRGGLGAPPMGAFRSRLLVSPQAQSVGTNLHRHGTRHFRRLTIATTPSTVLLGIHVVGRAGGLQDLSDRLLEPLHVEYSEVSSMLGLSGDDGLEHRNVFLGVVDWW